MAQRQDVVLVLAVITIAMLIMANMADAGGQSILTLI